jgi:hypothetical protein
MPTVRKDPTPSFLRRNGLGLLLLALATLALCGQLASGWLAYNDDLVAHGLAPVDLVAYIGSGHFISATFENWESEFFQMGLYVLLTAKLYQAGSAESRPLPGESEPAPLVRKGTKPWPVRRGGAWRRLYDHSLSITFALLFLVSFALHAYGSWRHAIVESLVAGEALPTFVEHVRGAQFWFESFQNWQSEFLSVLALVMLSIWLREKDSPESKAVEAPHSQTGS